MEDIDPKASCDPADSVIAKIKKAIRLANGTNSEGERDTALRLARSLAEKNGLAFEDIEASPLEAKAVHIEDGENEAHWIKGSEIGLACFILRKHFGVIVLVHEVKRRVEYADERGDTYTKIKACKGHYSWFGSRLNIDIARHVNHILLRESRSAWRKAQKEFPGLKRQSFMQGFFFVIDRKLTERPLRNDTENLVAEKKAAEKRLEEFKMNNGGVRDSQKRRTERDTDALALGAHAAKNINLARPCSNESSNRFALGMK